MRLLPGESIVGAAASDAAGDLLLVSHQGQLKRLAMGSLRRCQRGDLGEIGLRFNERSDQLVDLRTTTDVVAITTNGGSLRVQTSCLDVEDGRGAGSQLELPNGQVVKELIPLITG